ncbi:hypothetical protein Tco_0729007 [Tanacetum coccineum]|uniref:Uncharacterized protein n=1 Tax=Tanacetum coccineum TaxID=301880 RepID=A0ABQ4YQ33_9ASTR
MNQNYDPSFYNPIYSGFDQYRPSQFSVTHQLPQRSNKDMLLEMARLIKNNRILFNSNICPHEEMSIRVFLKQREEKRIEHEQAANLAVQKEQEEQAAQSFILNWNFPMIDDDEDYTIQFKEYLKNSSKAITPDLPTEEPDKSLSMGDENLSTILETESDEVIKSSVENLVPIPSESKGISDDICDVPFCDNDHFDAEFGLIDSLLSRDISITSPKIDFLPKEFTGELNRIDPILLGIDKYNFDEEE